MLSWASSIHNKAVVASGARVIRGLFKISVNDAVNLQYLSSLESSAVDELLVYLRCIDVGILICIPIKLEVFIIIVNSGSYNIWWLRLLIVVRNDQAFKRTRVVNFELRIQSKLFLLVVLSHEKLDQVVLRLVFEF